MALVERWRVPNWARIAWTTSLGAYSAAVAVLLTLDQNLKKAWPWVHDRTLLIGAIGGLTAITFLDSTRRAILRARVPKVNKNRVDIRNQLATVLVSVAEIHGLSAADLGCGLFLVQPRWLRRPERLLRIERVRLPDDLHESPVLFTKGKGAVGQCWEHTRAAHNDWMAINRRYKGPEDVDARWTRMSDATRRGFEKGEFVSLLGKYSEVLAIPVMVNEEFQGCIALDRRWNESDPHEQCVLSTDPTKKLVGAAARTLAASLGG